MSKSLSPVLRLFLVALLLLPLAACAGGDGSDASADSGSGSANKTAPDDGSAPDFSLASLDGSQFSLAGTAGEVRLIDFWATWCAPCREEIPMLQELNDTYDGFSVVAISDEDSEVLKEFVAAEGITYTNLIDDGGVAEEYLVLSLPTAFLVDRDGKIVQRFVGPKPRSVLDRKIRELLEQPQT